MKLKNSKISNLILWVCMSITLAIFGVYYYALYTHPGNMDTIETIVLLDWLYILFFVSILSTLFFAVIQFIKKWKEDRRSAFQPLIGIIFLIILLGISYLLGSGAPLEISGYEGKENIYLWLKITDMWIYSVCILLTVCVLSVFLGIIWSYIKKTR